MGDKTGISWTDSTWNPCTGCDPVSPGCKFCYAEFLAKKLQMMKLKKYANGFKFTYQPQDLNLPLHWRKPRKIFVNSMSDLFHENMTWDYLDAIFDVMRRARWHIFQVLTKRPERMLAYCSSRITVPHNVWLGTSIESYPFKYRIDILRQVPVDVRFLSVEPLLESLRPPIDLTGIHWVIVGGESGQHLQDPELRRERALVQKEQDTWGGRPGKWMPREDRAVWVREVRDECQRQNVPFFFKQFGGVRPKSGGRVLDGRTWDEYPAALKEWEARFAERKA